jgi:hypothetical protein
MENETKTINPESPITPEQAEMLSGAKAEIEAVLQKYNIVLVPVVVHFGEKTVSRIDIAPAPLQS